MEEKNVVLIRVRCVVVIALHLLRRNIIMKGSKPVGPKYHNGGQVTHILHHDIHLCFSSGTA